MKVIRYTCVLVFALLCIHPVSFAQNADTTSASPWAVGLIAKLAGSQAGFQNWSAGGVNTFALSPALAGSATRSSSSWEQH